MVENPIIEIIKKYLSALEKFGIHSRRAILFGSFANGKADENSDIDLIVISPEFDRPKEYELINKLWIATLKADSRIEPIPCGEKEWETDQSRPILEIARREGVEITIN